jgi:alpha-1,6-mannosyltransferase
VPVGFTRLSPGPHPGLARFITVPADPKQSDAPTTADRVIALSLLLVSALATGMVTYRTFFGVGQAALLTIGFVALALLVLRARWRRALRMRAVLVLTILLLVVAVARWPKNSTDLWSYAAYGRMTAEYGASPYRHTPSDFPNDSAARRVKPLWQDTESVYGPLWNGISAAVVSVTETRRLATRIAFQSLAALSVFLSVLLVARRTRDPAAVALIGLNPLVIFAVVNGGHNDALVGLALLAGVLLAMRERFALAGLAIAVAASVKIVALLGLAALTVWIWRKRGLRPAAITSSVAAGAVSVGYALTGGFDGLAPLREARLHISRTSIWLLADSEGRTNLFGLGRFYRFSPDYLSRAATLSTVVVLVLAAVLLAGRLRDRTPALAVASALVAYLLAATYVLPWYTAWVVPLLVLEWRSLLTRLVLLWSALYLLAYQYRQGLPRTVPFRLLFAGNGVVVFLALAIIVTLVVMVTRRYRPPRTRVEAVEAPKPVPARVD